MSTQLITLLALAPFWLFFICAGIREFQRNKSEGRAKYGFVYEEESVATRLTGIADHEEGYETNEFDPSAHNKRADKTTRCIRSVAAGFAQASFQVANPIGLSPPHTTFPPPAAAHLKLEESTLDSSRSAL